MNNQYKQAGNVRWFKDQYGFVAADGSNKDVFIHISALQESRIDKLTAGDRIGFQVRPGKKGDEAFDIVLLK